MGKQKEGRPVGHRRR